MRLVTSTVFTADSNGMNSLEEIYTPINGDICYVQETNRFYNWVAASTATPDGKRIVRKRFVPVATAGRWIASGPPGPGKIPPGFSNALNTAGFGFSLIGQIEQVTVGGAPTELITTAITTEGGNHWDSSNAMAMIRLGNTNPEVQARAFVPAANNVVAAIVDTSGGNIIAAQPVFIWVFRLATP